MCQNETDAIIPDHTDVDALRTIATFLRQRGIARAGDIARQPALPCGDVCTRPEGGRNLACVAGGGALTYGCKLTALYELNENMRIKLPVAVPVAVPIAVMISAAIILMALPGPAQARALFDIKTDGDGVVWSKPVADSFPVKNFNVHSVGKIALMITNFGALGTGYVGSPVIDGRPAPSLEYPINSNLSYLFTGAIWIGAVVGLDTLVSGAADGWSQNTPELWPETGRAGEIEVRSNLKSSNDYHPEAVSEQDFICAFTDTFPAISGYDQFDNRPHIPLYVAVKQSSYAWSYEYAEDFILFDFRLTNIGRFPLKNLFMGLYIDADVHHRSASGSLGATDDICGFRRTVATPPGFCISEDTINLAYIADNDGDPVGAYPEQNWSFLSPNGVTGIRVVRTPNPDLKYGFNWWVSNGDPALDFGPRMAGTEEDPYRPFGSHLGTPTGDRNKYYILSHPEFDYDQLFTAVSHTDEGFMQPPLPAQAEAIAKGFDTRYLLSFGPFDINPGDSLPITLAYLGGENFHTDPNNFVEYFDAFNPHLYYQTLSFEDFGLNARWASWVFDNPGYDTNGDGDSGKFCWNYIWADTTDNDIVDTVIIDSSKFYYAGDGVPDFRCAAPPPPPKVKVIPGYGEVTLRWNGQETENAIDVFSNEKDFEGYRVYYSRDNRQTDFVRLATYDIEDYKMYEFIIRYDTVFWRQHSAPIRGDSLRKLYGPDFDPYLYYDQFHYFLDQTTGRFFYFAPQDWNHSDLSDPTQIHRVYPYAGADDPADTTAEGYLRYYEYEYHIPNLQPSVPYYFSVTAFDYGSLKVDLGELETSPLVNAVMEYALPSAEAVEDGGLEVIVYPNPYRIDGGYARAGYENRDRTRSAERARAINFANLPRVCKIRIYSIDGDLVKELDHYYPDGGPGSQHEVWNLISRNTQAVVTGIYIWHVSSAMGEQMGKLVVIK